MKRINRILPVYAADISGVCSALYELGGMTVMHDASGCNSTYTTHDEPRWYSMDSMVYISALSELEAVMGDDDKLVRDIVDAARNLHPRFICLGGTPIPMMMGTDFKGLARMIEKETGIPTFGIATNGMHSYVRGAGEALRRIVERFCPTADELEEIKAGMGQMGKGFPEGPGSGGARLGVNILGATPLDFSLTGNVSGIRKFLSCHGMETVGCWAMESSLDDGIGKKVWHPLCDRHPHRKKDGAAPGRASASGGRDREEPDPVWRGSIRGRGVWPASRRSVYPRPAGRPFKGAGADCG